MKKMKIGLCGVEGFHTEFVGFQWVLSSGNCMCFLQGNCVFVCWKNCVFALEKLCVLPMEICSCCAEILCVFAEKFCVDVL